MLDNGSTPHYSSGMEITPSGLNPASVSPAGNTFDLSAIGLDEELARVEEAESEESDGQPDWAQEWHDFDPDC